MSWGIGFGERRGDDAVKRPRFLPTETPKRKRFRPVLAGIVAIAFAVLCLLAKCAKVDAADYHISAPGARIEVVSGQGGLFGFQFSNEFAIESDGFSYAARQGLYAFNLQSFDPSVAPTDALSHVLTSQGNPFLRPNNHAYLNAVSLMSGLVSYGESDNDIRIYTASLDDDGIIIIEVGGTLEHWENIEAFGLISPVPFQMTLRIHEDTPDIDPDPQRGIYIGERIDFSFGPSVPELNAGILVSLGCIVCAGLSRRKP